MCEDEEELWHGVRSIFNQGPSKEHAGRTRFEERIILVRAKSQIEAIERAESEAKQYAAENGYKFMEFLDCFHMFEKPGDLAEVFSLSREWDFADEDYINEFFDTGWEGRLPPTQP